MMNKAFKSKLITNLIMTDKSAKKKSKQKSKCHQHQEFDRSKLKKKKKRDKQALGKVSQSCSVKVKFSEAGHLCSSWEFSDCHSRTESSHHLLGQDPPGASETCQSSDLLTVSTEPTLAMMKRGADVSTKSTLSRKRREPDVSVQTKSNSKQLKQSRSLASKKNPTKLQKSRGKAAKRKTVHSTQQLSTVIQSANELCALTVTQDAVLTGPGSTVLDSGFNASQTLGINQSRTGQGTTSDPSSSLSSPYSFSSMSLDRSKQRDLSWEMDGLDELMSDSVNNLSNRHGHSLYTDFSQDRPYSHGAESYFDKNLPNRNRYRWHKNPLSWQQGGARNWNDEGPRGRYGNRKGSLLGDFYHQGWNSWGPDRRGWQNEDISPRPQSAGNSSWDRPSRSRSRWGQEQNKPYSERGMQNSQWQNLTKQFRNNHFHREGLDSREEEFSGESRAAQADSSGLEDSSSSGGGRKRPRSLDSGVQLPKSSRAKQSLPGSYDFLSPSSSRASSVSDLNSGTVQKPDSTSKQSKALKGPSTTTKVTKSVTGSGARVGALGFKKKQAVLKHKAAPLHTASGSKTVVGRMAKANEHEADGSGEGVLERAERMVNELRKKRQQTAPSRAAENAQRVGALRNALNTSTHRFHSAQKSFLRGYMSDSNSVANKSTAGGTTAVSATHKKHFSSTTTSETEPVAKSVSSTSSSVNGEVNAATFQGSDIDRIRHSIESSVRAEGRIGRTTVRPRSSSGSHSPAVSSSAVHLKASTSGEVGDSSTANRHPLLLSKTAVCRMVNTPWTLSQRSQLAKILRQHTTAVAARPRRIQLDGLYDQGDDGDSIGDMLKNISGLEEIGDCSELKNIKLEDLTHDDKLRIAQLIEEADSADRDNEMLNTDPADEASVLQRSHLPNRSRMSSSEMSSNETELPETSHHSRSPHRVQRASPSPCRPLSLDDLNTEERSKQKESADAVSHLPESAVASSSSPTVTSLRSGSPSRLTHVRSPSPMPSASPQHSPSPLRCPSLQRSTEFVRDNVDNAPVADYDEAPMDTMEYQPSDETLPDCSSGRPPAAPTDILDMPVASTFHSAGDGRSAREAGVLHGVMGLCQKQDAVLSEMRVIDEDLCGMYKSLIEIATRMSSLQKRRVQLQSEAEQLSQLRNDLLNGLDPDMAVALSATEGRPQHSSPARATTCSTSIHSEGSEQTSRRTSLEGQSGQPVGVPSVILPSWLSAPSTSFSRLPPVNRSGSRHGAESTMEHTSDVCLSGSVTSSVGSVTPRTQSHNSLDKNMHRVREMSHALAHSSVVSSKPPSSGIDSRASRVMLSISGAVDSSGDRDVTMSSSSSFSTEAVQSVVKNSMGADSSSGIGSSVNSTNSNIRQSLGSPLSDSSTQNPSSSQISQGRQQTGSLQPAEPSKIVIHNFASPNPVNTNNSQSPNVSQPKSPAVNVAYLGTIRSDLVQQIVRNLPLTSQLGEVSRPSVYLVKPGTPAVDSSSENPLPDAGGKSVPVDGSVRKSETRTTSALSISSDLSSGEQTVTASIPPLKLCEDSDKAGSKTCTPRSDSDVHSITSGVSLGEQIKLFSERNSFSQGTGSSLGNLSFMGTSKGEESEKANEPNQDIPDCAVVLERLDFENITIIPDPCRAEDDETDRRKKRKTRKDRDLSLQRRRRYVTESSSDGGVEEIADVDDNHLDSVSHAHDSSGLSGDVEQMEADCAPEELDSTLVNSREHLSLDGHTDEEVGSSQNSAPTCSISRSRLKLYPENQETFRSKVRKNSITLAGSSIETAGSHSPLEAAVSKDCLKIAGPCAPVIGMCVHNNLMYVGFQGTGVHSYTMKGELSIEYPMDTAQCFSLTPVGSGSQHYLAIGCSDHLTFLSINDLTVVSSLDTVVKVMCVLVVDAFLFAGLDSGAVLVVSLTTLQETRRFQASDCAVQCMTRTREGSTRLLIVASQDANIHVIDASSGLPIRIISSHSKTSFALCVLDHFVLSGSGDRKVMAHNVHTSDFAWEIHDHKGIITSICVDSGLLFTAGYDKIIRCYDLKSRKLLHLMYGAGKSIIMKMVIHNSILYTGNRDGEVEAVDLRDMGNFACECVSCSAVYGLKEHLWHHLVADHLLPNKQAMRCPWSDCTAMLDTRSTPVKAGEHLKRHIDGNQHAHSSGT